MESGADVIPPRPGPMNAAARPSAHPSARGSAAERQQQQTKSACFGMEVIIDPREIKLLFSFPRDGASHMQGAPLGKTRLGHREEPSVPFCQHQDGGESPQHLALLAFFLLMCPCGKHGLVMK